MNTTDKIIDIFYRVKPSIDWKDVSLHQLPLTGPQLKLTAPDLVYLVLELKERFSIEFKKQDFDNYRFNTVHTIIQTVESKVAEQNER